MTQEQITEGNKLIADFLGLKYEIWSRGLPTVMDENDKPIYDFEANKYWDHLMPVVEKIESMHDDFHGYFAVHISSNGCCIQGTKLRTDPKHFHPAYFNDITLDTKIESTWYAITMFIQWHNNKDKCQDT